MGLIFTSGEFWCRHDSLVTATCVQWGWSLDRIDFVPDKTPFQLPAVQLVCILHEGVTRGVHSVLQNN